MPTGTRKCKICGCEYPYCKTATINRFRYQDVACSPEHAAEYFHKIQLSRMNTQDSYTSIETDIIDDEYDETFELDFEDSDEEIAISMR